MIDADQHAAEARDAQLAVAHLQQPREGALDAARIEERRDALQHQEQAEGGEQVGEIARRGLLRCSGAVDSPGSFRYLKNSPSGLTTSRSPSLPRESS